MLERFNSFYQNTLAPMAHKGWQKIPTDKVSGFFQKTVPNFLHKAWNRRPSFPSFNKVTLVPNGLPDKVSGFFQKTVPTFAQSAWDQRPSSTTIKKIALVPVGLFALYKTYKWIQPFFYGKRPEARPQNDQYVQSEEKKTEDSESDSQEVYIDSNGVNRDDQDVQLEEKKTEDSKSDSQEANKDSNGVNMIDGKGVLPDANDDHSQNSQKVDIVVNAKQRSGNGANGNHDQNVLLQQKKIDEGELSDHDSDYITASDGEDDIINLPPFSQKSKTPQHKELSPLDRFSSNFPGQHLECTIGEQNMKLSDFVLNKLFRVHEQPRCEIDENDWYTLTYRDSRVITVSQLPPTKSQSVHVLALRMIIQNIMRFFTPQFEMSRVIKVQIKQVRYEIEEKKLINGTQITFDPSSFFLLPNRLKYTSHLKSLTICNEPIYKGRHIEIEVEHNSNKIEDKSGYLHHQQFVDTLNLYLQ